MDHRRWLHSDIMKLGIIAAALYMLMGVLAGNKANASDGHIRKLGSNNLSTLLNSTQLLTSSTTQGTQHQVGRSRLQEEDDAKNTLKLRLLHRNALESPERREFSTTVEEIIDFIEMDEMRVKGFFASINKASQTSSHDHGRSSKKDHGSPPLSHPNADLAPSSHDHGSSSKKDHGSSSKKDHGSPPLSHPNAGLAPFPSPPSHAIPPSLSPACSQFDGAPAPLPDGRHEEFEGRVVSGSSFPGNIGQYFVEFDIGTPGQRFLFIADTGSDLVWVPCSLCKACKGQASSPSPSSSSSSSLPFFPEASSTFTPISCLAEECDLVPPPLGATCSKGSPTSCTYAYEYSDLSQTTGVFAYDTITMRSRSGRKVEIQNVVFGCGTNNTGHSITKVGGVIGLGQGPISFPSQVGYMYGNKFSYCFTNFFNKKSSSALVFGDDLMGTELMSPLQFTPFVPNPLLDTFYYIQIETIKLEGRPLPIHPLVWQIDQAGNGGAVIDSGTTLSFFLQPAYDVIIEAFKQAIGYPLAPPTAGLDLCYNVSGIADPRFPSFSIIFEGGAVFRAPPKNYFLTPTHEIRCLGFMGSPGLSVLGNLIQQNYYVEYDRLNNQLGFAKAHCSPAF